MSTSASYLDACIIHNQYLEKITMSVMNKSVLGN